MAGMEIAFLCCGWKASHAFSPSPPPTLSPQPHLGGLEGVGVGGGGGWRGGGMGVGGGWGWRGWGLEGEGIEGEGVG